jgi:predicted amidohydrolase YtcJ
LNYIDLVNCGSKEELLTKVRLKITETPPGTWILGRGWDHEKFIEKEFPNKIDLDKLSKDHPIFLHRSCGHIAVVNSSALSISEIKSETKDPDGGIIDRFENGEPTGILKENAIHLVTSHIPEPSPESQSKWLLSAIKKLNEFGITSVHANDGNVHDLYVSLGEKLTVRTYLTPFIEELPDLNKIGAKTCKNSNKLIRWGRIKIYSDGSLGGETAALKDPYVGKKNKGMLLYSYDDLLQKFKSAVESGWQLETHAIGDYAAEMVIKAYEESRAHTNRAVLTHAQILNEELIKKMAELGIIANIQPIFINSDLHWAEKKIGESRMRFSYAWRTLMEKGIHCAGGSDAPVEQPNPLFGIHAAVNRQDNDGIPEKGWYPEQSLSVFEAVKLYTINSAFAEFQEEKKGVLKKGMYADFIVLNKDIFSVPKREIRFLKVMATFLGGNLVYFYKN